MSSSRNTTPASTRIDRRYSKATPSGQITMFIDNPPALEYLKLGEYFYVDFTAVPKKETVAA